MLANGAHPLRVLIVAGSPLARTGLATLLSDHENIRIVGQVDDALLAESLDVYRPEIVIWDLGYEPQQYIEQLAELHGAGAAVVGLIADKWAASESLPALVAAGLRGLAAARRAQRQAGQRDTGGGWGDAGSGCRNWRSRICPRRADPAKFNQSGSGVFYPARTRSANAGC